MTETPSTQPDQKKRRWLLPTLFVSLALNLLIVGIVVGAVLQGGRDKGGRPDGPARSLLGEPFVRALTSEDRRALGREMLSNRDALRENRADLRDRIERFLETLRQEEFDRDTIAGILNEQRQLAVTRQQLGEDLLLSRLEQMSVAERRAYADRLGENLRRFRRD